MPRARRRRAARRRTARRSVGRLVVVAIIAVIVGVVVISSIAEISAQSGPYDRMVNRSFGALASPVVTSSTQTGRALATAMNQAAGPSSTRSGLQQKLDQAVADATAQSSAATNLVPPASVGSLDQQLVAVFTERAAAATAVRTTVDGLLGLTPLPVPGTPASFNPNSTPVPSLTTPQAVTALSAVATQISKADADYAAVRRALAHAPGPVHLPPSAWVIGRAATAPLGATQLAAAPPALQASSALAVAHQLLISAVGLSPPAVGPVGSTIGDNCPAPTSQAAVAPPALVPPTKKLSAQVTVTNCGNVPESGIVVSLTVQLAPGSPPPKGSTAGASSPSVVHKTVALMPGASRSLALGPLAVFHGGLYVVTANVASPTGQTVTAGTSQAFLVQVSS
jgi:hypothetical protein